MTCDNHSTNDTNQDAGHNPNNPKPTKTDLLDPEPKYKAKVYAEVDGEVCPTLCDTGCQRSCISENLLRRHPNLFKNQIQPHRGKTISIDGSKVSSLGIINISFRINGRFMRMNCRIIKNLVYDFVLGWDFFSKYNCGLHPQKGYFTYENERVDFIKESLEISSTHFALAEDLVVPPLSKVITQAAYYLNPEDHPKNTDTVRIEPLEGHFASVAVGRSVAKIQDGQFPVELINPHEGPVTVPAGQALGHVIFTSDEMLKTNTHPTDIELQYGGEDSGYESEGDPEDTQPKTSQTTRPDKETPEPDPPPDTIDSSYKIDYSTVAEDARPMLEDLKELLEVKHANTFAKHDRDRGKTELVSHHARIKPGPPIHVRPYRATPEMQKEMDKQVHEMLADGLVSHSNSSFSAPVLLTPKKCGGWRFCTDFRKVNARCEKVVYPLPRIEDTLRGLKEPRFFSTMDLQKGFWQVPIVKEDRKYFAFSTGTMHVEYNVMPMGALNSSSTMQALMALILRGLPPEHVVCFLDDILVASNTMEDHLQHLDAVLCALARAGLKLNPKKCQFAQESVSCLGHRLSRDGIGPDPANLDKIKKWKAPKNKTEIRQFLGLTGYYRQMIRDYSQIATPLTDLTKNEAEWKWGKEEQEAFETLRDYLTSSHIMAYPDFEKPFWVKSDASEGSVGYVLTQFHDKREKVIAYGSKKLTDTQRRYSTYDREFFGVLTAVRTYSHYLRHTKFFVVTDHRPLLNLRKVDPKTDATGRRVRWSIELNLYDFDVIYKKGRKHSDADAMSRLTDHNDYAEEEEFAGFIAVAESKKVSLLGLEDEAAIPVVELISDDDKRKELRAAQDADPVIANIKHWVKQQKPPPEGFPNSFYKDNFPLLVIQEGVLCRKALSGPSKLPILQAIIPPKLVPTVLEDAHGSRFAGHPGHHRLINIILRHAVWPRMYKDCKKHIEQCKPCDRLFAPNPPPRTELQPMLPSYVFEQVSCDLLKLPPVPGGWRYICVFYDVFSRHVTFYKFKDKTSLSFAKALEDYVLHMGCPKTLTCDNGAEFRNELVDAVTKVMGIKQRTSVVYRPQSQGHVERTNREIIQGLTVRLLQYGMDWPDHMHYVALAHNAAPASRHGESPNLVFFGRELPIPSFTDLSINTLRAKSVQQYVSAMKSKVKHVHETIRAESKARTDKVAEAYNRKANHKPLQEGDYVFYKEADKNRDKLTPRTTGPVQVKERKTNAKGQPGVTYSLQYKDGETITRNYEQLKRARAKYAEPIAKYDRPLAPPPNMPCLFFDSDDENATTITNAPVATRTRSKRPPPSKPDLLHGVDNSTTEVPAQPCPGSANASKTPRVQFAPQPSETIQSVTPPATQVPNAPTALPALSSTALSPGESNTPSEVSIGSPNRATISDATLAWDGDLMQHHPPLATPTIAAPVALQTPAHQADVHAIEVTPLGAARNHTIRSDASAVHNLQAYFLTVPSADMLDSSGSRANSPELLQNTVVQNQAGMSSAATSTPHHAVQHNQTPSSTPATPVDEIFTPISNEEASRLQPPLAPAPSPGPEETQGGHTNAIANQSDHNLSGVERLESPSPVNSPVNPVDDRNSFETFLDTIHEELQIYHDVGRRKITIITYKGHEFRRDRASEMHKPIQLWVCRHAHKFHCSGKFKLHVRDLERVTVGATVENYVSHNHLPYRIEPCGLVDVSVISSVKTEANSSSPTPRIPRNQTSPPNDANESRAEDIDEGATAANACNCNGLSRINIGDISADFQGERINSRVRSSPIASTSAWQPAPDDEAGPTLDLTTVIVDTSKTDTRGFTIRKFIPCPRHGTGQDQEDRQRESDDS